MTDFLQRHPGGANAILAEAGKDVRYVGRWTQAVMWANKLST